VLFICVSPCSSAANSFFSHSPKNLSHSTSTFIIRSFSAILKHLSPAAPLQPQKHLLGSNREGLMPSAKQTAANRMHSQKSTGPRTTEGKIAFAVHQIMFNIEALTYSSGDAITTAAPTSERLQRVNRCERRALFGTTPPPSGAGASACQPRSRAGDRHPQPIPRNLNNPNPLPRNWVRSVKIRNPRSCRPQPPESSSR
jgi:hypothetical protein